MNTEPTSNVFECPDCGRRFDTEVSLMFCCNPKCDFGNDPDPR